MPETIIENLTIADKTEMINSGFDSIEPVNIGENKEKKPLEDLSVEELKILAEEKEKVETEKKEEVETEETKKKEEEQAVIETERVEKLAQEQGKSIEDVIQDESDKKEMDRLEDIAKKEGISVDAIKENEVKDKSIVERHEGNPLKIAKALRGLQSSYDKLQNELKRIKEQQAAQSQILSDKEIETRCEENREKIVEQYIKIYPNEAEELSEDVIFDRGKTLVKASQQKSIEKQRSELKEKADERRGQLLENLSEVDREFKPNIERALKETLDEQIIHQDFDVKELIVWARGSKYTKEHVKELVDAAFKRGQEQSKILGEKTKIGGAKPIIQQTYSHNLTDDEKERAKTIFYYEEKWPDSKKFAEYEKIKDKDF